jgi:DNA-binding GntR family transcriptional regulator
MILAGEIRPGEALVEAALAKALLVSKTPVREALKALSGTGLVQMLPYKGATVRVVDRRLAREVFDVRAFMEPEAVRRSVANRWNFGGARAALDQAKSMSADRAREKLALINRRFHMALIAGCGNSLMLRVLGDLSDQAALVTVTGWRIHPTWPAEMVEHHEILRVAESGDADRAAELMREHITTFADRVIEGLPDAT